MLMTYLHVAIGGACGAMLRFAAGQAMLRLPGTGLPVSVLSVNVLGSFLMGLFVVLSFERGWQHLNPFVTAGVLGGFTTFSAFSLEAFTLYERGQIGAAGLYVVLSVCLSIAGLAGGVWLARGMLT